MKRHLRHARFELDPAEREAVWHGIRRATHGPDGPEPGPRSSFRPALAVTAVTAVLALATVWQSGTRNEAGLASGRIPESHIIEIADASAAGATERGLPDDRPAPAPHRGLAGRVVDRETGEPVPHVPVQVAGTALAATTDRNGEFRFFNLPADGTVQLEINALGYSRVDVPLGAVTEDGQLEDTIALDSHIVETLQAFDVEGAEYMVEVKSSVAEHTVSSRTFEKYAIDSVEDALSKQAGVVMRAGEPNVRGGRDGGSVTGGTTPPNGEQVELMYFESAGVNPFVATEDDALSTFATDVDDASWTLARNYLKRGLLPPPDAIRVEEFVNAFDAGWPRNDSDQPFRIHADGRRSPYGSGYHLLRVGLVGQHVTDEQRKPADLVFVIDVSGSMSRGSRLGTVKRALHGLVEQLREGDRVGIVVYGSSGEVRLPLTGVEHRRRISGAIDALRTGGSTNAAAGLELGYRMAREAREPGVISRLVLCSDGVANNGVSTDAGGILDAVRLASDEGITLSTVGFGMGNYNDVLMEKLADRGDGNYSYVDSQEEADRVFRGNLTGRLQTIAREAKVQVEFDPRHVRRWRLLGYENRDVADRDFRNDAVDAGEVGADHQVTALYELKLEQPADPDWTSEGDSLLPDSGDEVRVGTIRLRWEAPAHDVANAGRVTEIERPITFGDLAAGDRADDLALRVQAVVAEFAEILRGSYWARESDLLDLVPVLDRILIEAETGGGYDVARVKELRQLVRQAADLKAALDDR